MRIILLVIVWAFCNVGSVSAEERKPTGEELFDILFSSSDLQLDDERLCSMKSATREDESLTLGQHLATNLSVSYETDHVVEIEAGCVRSKFEDDNNEIIDAWDCSVEIFEHNLEGEFISSSMIAFLIDQTMTGVLPGSLRCF